MLSQQPEPPLRLSHRGNWYLLIANFAETRGIRTSWVWKYGDGYARENRDHEVLAAWRCHIQDRDQVCASFCLLRTGAVSNAQRHLREKHHLNESTSRLSATSSVTPSDASQGPDRLQRSVVTALNVSQFKKRVMQWVVEEHIPLSKLSSPAFRDMMLAAQPSLKRYLPSPSGMRNQVISAYAVERERTKAILRASLSKIHLSFDIWTSPNRYAIIAVIAHFLADEGHGPRNKARPLALRRMRGRHGAEECAAVLHQVITEYEIADNLGVFIADNPDTNDNAVTAVLGLLGQSDEHRRSRCIGHIINLAAKDFLFGQDVEAFEYDITGVGVTDAFDSIKMRKAQDIWRKKGPVGKLHNLVVFVQASPQRVERFKSITVGDNNIDGKSSYCLNLN